MIENDVILRTQNLDIGYGKGPGSRIILRNINAGLRSGELTCLLGPNGVGKSTLLRTLSGVQRPLAGTVALNGSDLFSYDRQDLAREVSLTLTDKTAGNLSVYELIALGRYPHTGWTGRLKKEDDDKIQEAIAATRSESILEQKIYELSDGQLQKAMIARALAQDGNLMILDEPSAHLDLNNKVEILILLQRLASEHHKAILIATHELDLALQIADRLWLVAFDQPLTTGVPEELVLNGNLTDLFRSDSFSFDLRSGKIKIKKPVWGEVGLEGSGKEYFWTMHALERAGLGIHGAGLPKIVVAGGSWRLHKAEGIEDYGSLDELLKEVRKLKAES